MYTPTHVQTDRLQLGTQAAAAAAASIYVFQTLSVTLHGELEDHSTMEN